MALDNELVVDLLTYIEQVEKLKVKPAFSVPTEYFAAHQHELKDLPEMALVQICARGATRPVEE
jgi:hypothetical protein